MKKTLMAVVGAAIALTACNNSSDKNVKTIEQVDYTAVDIPDFVADSAYRYIGEQLAFGPRVPGTKEHKQCAQYLTSKMQQWADTVYVQDFNTVLWDGKTVKGTNIIASFDPANPNRVLLAAHWDSRAYADHDPNPDNHHKAIPGANDGASGVGLTVEVSKALETAYQTLLYQLGMVSTGGNKRGFLKSQRKLGQEEINTLKQAWKNLYGNNTENVVVLNNGLEFQEASNSAVETQLNESKKTLQDEINSLFHLYPDDFDRTFKEAIYPIVKAFETALNRDLLLEKEKKNHFFEFDVKEIIRASLKERYESYKLAKETGFLTINEIRRYENLNYVEGLDVVNVGLGAVLYDTNTHQYYTPNTGTVGTTEVEMNDMLEGHEEAQEFEASGNSASE